MEIENQNKPLTVFEKSLLKKLILDEPKRPTAYKFSGIYRLFNYETTSEESVKEAIANLVLQNYIKEDKGYYSLTREAFLELKNRYKILLFLNSSNSAFTISAVVGLIASVATLFPAVRNYFEPSNGKLDNSPKDKIELRIEKIEKQIASYDTVYKANAQKIDSTAFSKTITELNTKYLKLTDNINSLNSLLQDNPSKFIEIATLKRDIDDIKKQMGSNDESLKREVDRISSYNNTLIVFMITFLVAYIGIGVFNFINRNKNTAL